jgi:hypothetical protein
VGWSGFCCAGCASSSWQIGTSVTGPVPISSGVSEIVARRRIWHQTARSDAAKPTVGFSLWREIAFRFSARRTGGHSICQGGTTSAAAFRRQARCGLITHTSPAGLIARSVCAPANTESTRQRRRGSGSSSRGAVSLAPCRARASGRNPPRQACCCPHDLSGSAAAGRSCISKPRSYEAASPFNELHHWSLAR